MIKLSYEQQIAFNSLSIIVGNALYALTVVLFLVPSGLITGGATGIGRALVLAFARAPRLLLLDEVAASGAVAQQ